MDTEDKPGARALARRLGAWHAARIVLLPDQQFGCLVAANRVSPAHEIVPRVVRALVQGEDIPDLITQCDRAHEERRQIWHARFTEERRSDPEIGSPWPLDAFVGTYRHGGLGTVRITRPSNEGLWLSVDHASSYEGPLVRYGGRLFEYHGDLDAASIHVVATPALGDKPRIRFRVEEDRVVGFEWEDMWFGNASLFKDTHVSP